MALHVAMPASWVCPQCEEKRPLTIYLNNCERRPHAEYFPSQAKDELAVAFYDFDNRQWRNVPSLTRGIECMVATPVGTSDYQFSTFRYSHMAERPAPEGEDVRVLFGTELTTKVLAGKDAKATAPYSVFFESDGGLKRGCVIRSGFR